MGEMSCPQKGYIQQGSAVVLGRKERPCNNRKRWEARAPDFQAKPSGNNGCLRLGNIGQEMKGCWEGVCREELISATWPFFT